MLTTKRIRLSFLLFSLCLVFKTGLQAQLVYTQQFTDKLEALDLYFYEPTDNWLHLLPVKKDSIFNYDLMLISEENDVDVRIILNTIDEKPDLLKFPHVEFTRILTNVATNDPEADILVSQLSGATIKDAFNADWALMADFIPKKWLSLLAFGRLYSLYKDDKGIASIIILTDSEDIDAIYTRLISFKPEDIDH
jgi:hypothetical protein